MEDKLEGLDFTESYLLGWKKTSNTLLLYLDIFIEEGHEKFEKFEKKSRFGCYKLGIFEFDKVQSLQGLEVHELQPTWDQKLKEYKDIEEINFLELSNGYVIFETDNKKIAFDYSSSNLIILDSSRFL